MQVLVSYIADDGILVKLNYLSRHGRKELCVFVKSTTTQGSRLEDRSSSASVGVIVREGCELLEPKVRGC